MGRPPALNRDQRMEALARRDAGEALTISLGRSGLVIRPSVGCVTGDPPESLGRHRILVPFRDTDRQQPENHLRYSATRSIITYSDLSGHMCTGSDHGKYRSRELVCANAQDAPQSDNDGSCRRVGAVGENEICILEAGLRR